MFYDFRNREVSNIETKRRTQSGFPLTRESIDAASVHIEKLLEGITSRWDALRIRLAAEEVMHYWGKSLGEDANCTILYNSRFGQRSIRLAVSGPHTNPKQCEDDAELDAAGNFILEQLGLAPSFQYEKGANLLTFQLAAKKPNQLVWIDFAVALWILAISSPWAGLGKSS